MKKLLFLSLSFLMLEASNFRLGINTLNIQDSEGGGIALLYAITPNLSFETSYNQAYIRGVKNTSTTESWNQFNTQRVGIRYYLKSYANDEIRLFSALGIEHIFKNDGLSSNTPGLNTYGLLGVDFKVDDVFNITFAFGSGGKGEQADQLQTSPNYAHGFNAVVGIELNF